MLKKTLSLSLQAAILVLLSCGSAQATLVTISTFADPAAGASTPLFTVDLVNDLIIGSWDDYKTGLTLQIPYTGNAYTDAFFTTTGIDYTGGISGGVTGGGTIKFFADGQSINTTPLIQVDFNSGYVTPFDLGAMDMFYSNNVTITGSEITGTLANESFSFSFANQVPIDADWNNGFTTTASFSSSAVPEPATICLLALGSLVFVKKKR